MENENTTLNAIAALLSKIEALEKKIDTGSRSARAPQPRPNVVYRLLDEPTQPHHTPQIAALQTILFSQDKSELTETELDAILKQGRDAGILRTHQDPMRIFKYYRKELADLGQITWL